CFVLFGCIRDVWLPYETRCKTGRSSAKVRATKSRRNFRNEHTQSTPLYPKLMFCGVSYYLCALGTIWSPYETRCKTDRTSAKVRAPMSLRNFFATNAPNPPHRTLN